MKVSRVAELRDRANLTQRELALRVGVTETTIRNWESNRYNVEVFERVARLCKELGCAPSELVASDSAGNGSA
jgi:transcriptional regulator with XRE-family HTH domain